jgi:hypothetical protein
MNIEIPLVKDEDLKKKVRGSRIKKERYSGYRAAIRRILPWIMDNVAANGAINVKTSDLAKEMGQNFVNKSETSVLWALKYVLFHEGIWVEGGIANDDSPTIRMRAKKENDRLPPSLLKLDEETDNDKETDNEETDEETDEETGVGGEGTKTA